MESVNDIHGERVNFLTGTLFRSPEWRVTRAERRSSLASSSVKRALAIGAAAIAAAIVVGDQAPVRAELENQVFTAKAERLRLVVPRGWRATDQPSYPGLLLWMMRSEPEGKIVLTDEPFTRDVYCSWPVRCQMSHDALPAKLACALGAKLAAERLRVGPVQAGPKENEEAGMPSVWFEYDDGKHFLRQAVAIDEDHVVSLVLSAPTSEARNAHVRAFEQALRTLRPLNAEELGAIGGGSALPGAAGSGSGAIGAGSALPGAAGSGSGSAASGSAGSAATLTGSGAAGSAAGSGEGSGVMARTAMPFVSALPPRIEPVGPCTRK
jgi:hypothetical protein